MISKDKNAEFGVCLKLMNVGFLKSFTVPATTYFGKFHGQEESASETPIQKWGRLAQLLLKANPDAVMSRAFAPRVDARVEARADVRVNKNTRFEGGETDDSYYAKRRKPGKDSY